MPERKYWVTQTGSELGNTLKGKIDSFAKVGLIKGLRERYGRAFSYYLGTDPSGIHTTSKIIRAGEQGELAAVRVNHSRPLVNALLNLIVAPKITWTPKATNIDYDSIRECDLAAAVLEYYWREKQVQRFAIRALEEALVFGDGFVHATWDEDAGSDFAVDPGPAPVDAAPEAPAEEPTPFEPAPTPDFSAAVEPPDENPLVGASGIKVVKSGDVRFHNVSTWDVIRDWQKSSWEDLDWVIVRDPTANKYDTAARFPEQADKVLDCGPEADYNSTTPATPYADDTDTISVFYFYHKKTAAMPKGREVVFLCDGTVLSEGDLSYAQIPVHRISASEMLGTPFGYTPFWDILGVQELMDSLHTSIASNQSTFATQLVAIPLGADVPIENLAGGIKAVYYDPAMGAHGVPSGINLTRTPAEVFQYVDALKGHQELLLGLNSVVRGEAPGDASGAAMALLQSQSLQQSSVTQGAYLRFVESLGTALLDIIRDRAEVEQQIAVVGKGNQFLVDDTSFNKESFSRVRKVQVEIGNPLAQSPAGRAEMAKDLMTLGLVKTPDQYQEILTSGRMEPLTQGLHHEILLIRSENEMLSRGEVPVVVDLDNHPLHAQEHRAVLANPQVRKDPKLVRAILTHIQEHEVAFYQTSPSTLMLVGQQPPMMPGGAPPPDQGGPNDKGTPPNPLQPPPGNPAAGAMPSMPNQPTNPASGQEWDPATGGGIVSPAR